MDVFNFALTPQFAHMLLRLFVCVIVSWFIIDRLYFQKSHRRDYYFTFLLISIAIFFLVFFMIFVLEDMKGKTGIGIGIGLFGIFSIMRYRTDTIPVREMTYLFVLICLAVINALAEAVTFLELLLTNGIFIVAIWICELRLKIQPCKLIQYDRIELIKPDRRDELKADLEKRLGVHVKYIHIGGLDLLRDMAIIKVYYEEKEKKSVSSIDKKTRLKLEELAVFLLMLAPLPLHAEGDDFGLHTYAAVEKKIGKNGEVGANAEFRSRDNTSRADRWSGEVYGSYKLTPWLKASAGYTLLYEYNERISYYDETSGKVIDGDAEVGDPKKRGTYWATRHRFNVSLTASQKFGNVKLSLRERWQYTYRPSHTVDERWSFIENAHDGEEHTYSGKGKNVLRSRLKVAYDKRKAPLSPFISAELFNAWNIEKVRYIAGVDWKIAKHHYLEAYYGYQHVWDDDDNEPNRHFIGLGYTYKL